ncbi:MAG: molybdopterin molybdotransferase MoeA, partial [Burkholderiaceae bacterium]|nr:molybdopterin molybdotransferase MoeA [Burkholderiaceae bacterium]
MRPPMKPLKSLDDALAALLVQASSAPLTEIIATYDADGRVLAQDCVSALQVPHNDNSAMDGYAVRSTEVTAAGVELPVSQRIPAGSVGQPLQPGTAARIFTGATLPEGADAVLMQEDCEAVANDGPGTLGATAAGLGQVRINAVPPTGQWVRRAGEDIALGTVVLPAGTRLTPAGLGLAASIGLHQLRVARRPRVALFSTGDELVMPGDVPPDQMRPGAIYNSNRFFLRAMLQRLGCEVTDMGIVPDRRDATVEAMRTAAQAHDVILTSGGVSVGEEDHIKPAV